MIQFVTVSKTYPENIVALADISLEISNGEFVFLVGPSGSGKTTLIRLLIREEIPSSGKIYFQDEDITHYNRSNVYGLRRKIGVIFQDFKLIPELTAFENISFAMEAAGKSEKEIRESVPYLLEIVGLANRMHFFPKQLSGGEKQKVAIARAMANNPKLLIADEPTGNLDPDSSWDIVQILSKINNWGTTVLMSTHGSDIVNSLHKRVIKLVNGQIERDDIKGSYDTIDEFTFKIMNQSQQNAHALNQKESIKHKDTETVAKNVKFRKKETDKKEAIAQKHEKPFKDKAEKNIDDLLDNEISEAEIAAKAKKITVNDLDLQEKTKKQLKKFGYDNLQDLISAGVEELQKLVEKKDLTQQDLQKISMVIKNFISKLAVSVKN